MNVVDGEGFVFDLSLEDYLADPTVEGSLSASSAALLLPPSCPARFAYQREHPPRPTAAQQLGTAAHTRVLGNGPTLRPIPYDDYKTKAAQEARDKALAAGEVPVKESELEVVDGMAAALRRHELAASLFDVEAGGRAEVSMFARDAESGVMLRGRLDWLPDPRLDGRLLLPDYKTCRRADPDSCSRALVDFGYHRKAPWYRNIVWTLLRDVLDEPPIPLFVFQEKEPPYLISVVELPLTALEIGERQNRRAIARYVECVEAGRWPGYNDDDVALVSLPRWYEKQQEDW